MERRSWLEETIYFAVVGAIAVGGSWAILYVLTEGGVVYLVSLIVALAFNYTFTFMANKFVTYRNTSTKVLRSQIIQYLAMVASFYVLNTIFLYVLVAYAGMWYMAAQVCISIALSFASMAISPRIFRT